MNDFVVAAVSMAGGVAFVVVFAEIGRREALRRPLSFRKLAQSIDDLVQLVPVPDQVAHHVRNRQNSLQIRN